MSEQPTDPAILEGMADVKRIGTEAQKGKETAEAFKEAVARITDTALSEIEEKFDNRPKKEGEAWNRWEYHNSGHTRDIMQRTRTILEAAGADERAILLGGLAAAAHDVVQLWEEREDKIPVMSTAGTIKMAPRTMLARKFGDNEASSAEWLAGQMTKANEGAPGEIFTEEDITTAAVAIFATVPVFEGGAVIQPHFYKDSPLITAAVALSDLGDAGMGAPGTFIELSRNLFREENLDIAETIRSGEPISDDKKEEYRQRMLIRTQGQETFIQSRKIVFETRDILAIPKDKRDAVRQMFGNFDITAQRMSEINEVLQEMPFEDVAAYMGYGRPEEVKVAHKKVEAAISSKS